MRRTIGAALQEAALDPLLTGREHLKLQLALHGIPRAERGPRTDELLERVGLRLAADRKIGGYSGGMKRRLDLALALAHRPRILFLDEPTTGLDPQSRSALWDEVVRLKRDEGVTVFLTTQYLEEADVLADRVGIIDHGLHRRRGDAGGAEGRDRAADGRGGARPTGPRPARGRGIFRRFGALQPSTAGRRRPARRPGRPRRHRPRARLRAGRASPTSTCMPRRWTTSSWRRRAARSRAPRRSRGAGRAANEPRLAGPPPRAALGHPNAPPAGELDHAADLSARPDGGEHRRARRRHEPARASRATPSSRSSSRSRSSRVRSSRP